MKKKYMQPACKAHSLDTADTLLVSSVSVHPDESLDASDALVKEDIFDFNWE